MKRIFVSLIVAIGLLFPALSLAGTAGAVDIFRNGNCPNGESVCNNVCNTSSDAANSSACASVRDQQNNTGDNPIIDVIRVAINVISYIIGIAAVVGLIVNSIRMIVSGGDSNAAASARGGIIACLVGIAIATLALVIVNLVIGN